MGRDARRLWTALRAAGLAVEVVVVGRDPERLAAAEPVLAGWTRAPAAPDGGAERSGEAARGAEAELAAVRAAVARGDLAALETYGGINGALARRRPGGPGPAGRRRRSRAAGRGARRGCRHDPGAGRRAVAAAVWAWWPFLAPGAAPVADLIAMRSPRLHAAIRAWHYLAPAVAFVGLWSVAVAVGRVWLAGGGRRRVVGALPPWPAASHAVGGRESSARSDTWRGRRAGVTSTHPVAPVPTSPSRTASSEDSRGLPTPTAFPQTRPPVQPHRAKHHGVTCYTILAIA